MGIDHPECPERLGAINDQLLITGLLNYMHTYDAPLATAEQLQQAHSALYVRDVAAHRPESGYVQVDPDTRMNSYTNQAATRAAGAAVLAADLVIMATHGLRGWRRLVLGSVTEGVLRGSDCPVRSTALVQARMRT